MPAHKELVDLLSCKQLLCILLGNLLVKKHAVHNSIGQQLNFLAAVTQVAMWRCLSQLTPSASLLNAKVTFYYAFEHHDASAAEEINSFHIPNYWMESGYGQRNTIAWQTLKLFYILHNNITVKLFTDKVSSYLSKKLHYKYFTPEAWYFFPTDEYTRVVVLFFLISLFTYNFLIQHRYGWKDRRLPSGKPFQDSFHHDRLV